MSGYAEPPLSRPKWFTPLLAAWLLTGLPAAIVLPYFWITGTSPTESPPPATGAGDVILGLVLQLIVAAYVFGSPILLAFVEREYRRRVRTLQGNLG